MSSDLIKINPFTFTLSSSYQSYVRMSNLDSLGAVQISDDARGGGGGPWKYHLTSFCYMIKKKKRKKKKKKRQKTKEKTKFVCNFFSNKPKKVVISGL